MVVLIDMVMVRLGDDAIFLLSFGFDISRTENPLSGSLLQMEDMKMVNLHVENELAILEWIRLQKKTWR